MISCSAAKKAQTKRDAIKDRLRSKPAQQLPRAGERSFMRNMRSFLQLVLVACILLPLVAALALPVTCICPVGEVPVNICGTLPNNTQTLKTDVVPPSCCKQLPSKAESGQYTINLGDNEGEFSVYCDMDEGMLGGGWTIIQRRVSCDDFNKDWKSYKNGFGNFNGNFWLGLEKIHRITSTENHELYIGMRATLGRMSWARYCTFRVGDEASKYSLTVDGYEGTAGDALGRVNGKPFSTFDNDNEEDTRGCSDIVGGWWFYGCDTCNLNGRYYAEGLSQEDGINWQLKYSISTRILNVVMAIRPKCRDQIPSA